LSDPFSLLHGVPNIIRGLVSFESKVAVDFAPLSGVGITAFELGDIGRGQGFADGLGGLFFNLLGIAFLSSRVGVDHGPSNIEDLVMI